MFMQKFEFKFTRFLYLLNDWKRRLARAVMIECQLTWVPSWLLWLWPDARILADRDYDRWLSVEEGVNNVSLDRMECLKYAS